MEFKYPKFVFLIFSIFLAYFLFEYISEIGFFAYFLDLGYFGSFLTGIAFAYGFTAAPATAIFLILSKTQNVWIAGFFGGLGALVGDLIIFKFIRTSFSDEIEKLSREKILVSFNSWLPEFFKKYFVPVLGGFIIASPLPDEIGVTLLATSKLISIRIFMLMSFLLNTLGIYAILVIGSYI